MEHYRRTAHTRFDIEFNLVGITKYRGKLTRSASEGSGGYTLVGASGWYGLWASQVGTTLGTGLSSRRVLRKRTITSLF